MVGAIAAASGRAAGTSATLLDLFGQARDKRVVVDREHVDIGPGGFEHRRWRQLR